MWKMGLIFISSQPTPAPVPQDGLDLKEDLTVGGKSPVRNDSSFINSQEAEMMNRRAAKEYLCG